MDVESYVRRLVIDAEILADAYTTHKGRALPKRFMYDKFIRALNQFQERRDPRLLLLTGLRGVGKTVLLFQLYRYITRELDVPPTRVLYVSMDASPFTLSEILQAFVRMQGDASPARLKEPIYVLVDEAHYDQKWGKTAKTVYDQAPNVFAVYTGSAALLLEASPDILRRARRISVFPLSFPEYIEIRLFWEGKAPEEMGKNVRKAAEDFLEKPSKERFERLRSAAEMLESTEQKLKKEIEELYVDFLLGGGFPGPPDPLPIVHERVRDVAQRVVESDLPKMANVESKTVFMAEKVLLFLAHTAPGPVSLKSIAERFGISPSVVGRALELLQKSGIVNPISERRRSSKRLVRSKYYLASPTLLAALAHLTPPLDSRAKGVLLETAVANTLLQLRKRGITVEYAERGPDFILSNGVRIEVGWGKTSASQLRGKGILVTLRRSAEFGDVVTLPAWWIT